MGLLKKVKKAISNTAKYVTFNKNPLHKLDDVINKNLGGYGNLAAGAGIVAAGVLTGGAAAGLGATLAGSSSAVVGAGAVAGAGLAAGSVGAGIAEKKAVREAEHQQAQADAEAKAEQEKADRQRRASLYSLRKQVGKTVGGNTAIRGGSSYTTDKTQDYTGVVLG